MAPEDSVQAVELNTTLMESTFRIFGPGAGGTKTGTIFLAGRPYPKDPGRGKIVLITAAHVLNDITADTATVVFREKVAGRWERRERPVQIRDSGKPRWLKHPGADVAVMYISSPVPWEPWFRQISSRMMRLWPSSNFMPVTP